MIPLFLRCSLNNVSWDKERTELAIVNSLDINCKCLVWEAEDAQQKCVKSLTTMYHGLNRFAVVQFENEEDAAHATAALDNHAFEWSRKLSNRQIWMRQLLLVEKGNQEHGANQLKELTDQKHDAVACGNFELVPQLLAGCLVDSCVLLRIGS